MEKLYSEETAGEKTTKLVLFLLSPILALIYSLKNVNSKSSYKVFFWFTVYFAFAMVFDKSDVRADGAFIAFNFQNYAGISFENYIKDILSFFSRDNILGVKDIYSTSLMYFTSRFTGNYHIFFALAGCVYAFFMLKSFRYFSSTENVDTSYLFFILLYVFFSSQIYQIAGVRFGTASWIAILCVFKILVDGDKRFLALLCITPLIHLSFLYVIVITLIALATMRMEKMWQVLLIASFLFSEYAVQFVESGVSVLNLPFVSEWAGYYAGEDSLFLEKAQGTGFYWVEPIFEFIGRAFFLIVMLLFIKNSKQIKANSRTRNLYLFVVVWYTFSNFTMAIPHMGLRFMTICKTFIAFIWLVNFKDYKYNTYMSLYPLFFLLPIKKALDIYLETLEPSFLLSPLYTLYDYIINYIPITTGIIDRF